MVYRTSLQVRRVNDISDIPSVILHKILGKYPARYGLLWFPPGNICPQGRRVPFLALKLEMKIALLSDLHLRAYIRNGRMSTG
jgi:hypothetical protein